MLASLVLALYIFCGFIIVSQIFKKNGLIQSLWLGGVFGILLFMWLPAIFAFVFKFSLLSQYMSIGVLILATLLTLLFSKPFSLNLSIDKSLIKLILYIALPLLIFTAYLFYTHILRPVDGSLYVGQSTYGDLPMHLAMASSLKNSSFPPEYNILIGKRLAYPFLVNSLSSSLMLLGLDLRASFILPSVFMAALVYIGYIILSHKIIKSKKVTVLSSLLFFTNGGLGFLYVFDMLGVSLGTYGENQLQMGTWFERLRNVFEGWYQTPPNHAEFTTYNLRWSNIIADLIIPQRSFLAGLMLVLPAIYLLYEGIEKRETKNFIFLGLLAGAMPLVHTHSFLALFLLSLGWFIYDIAKNKKLKPWLIYAIIAGVLALPQLLLFTFKQASIGSQTNTRSFLELSFNWVNGDGGMKDSYFWFYIKNIGLPFIMLIFAMFEKDKLYRFIFFGAFFIFIPAEFIRFQPNIYDNNKLLYIWYGLCLIPVSDYMLKFYAKLKGLKAQKLIAVLAAVVLFLSGTLSLVREAVSEYQMFDETDIALSEWVNKNSDIEDIFITSTQHINPVSSLSGRRILAGPDIWLFYHGFSKTLAERKAFLNDFYLNPYENIDTARSLGAKYFVVGPYERRNYDIEDLSIYDGLKKLYENEQYVVYSLEE